MVSQGSNGGGEKKGKREREAGIFLVPGGVLFKTWEETERYLREAMGEDSDGDKGDDEGEVDD